MLASPPVEEGYDVESFLDATVAAVTQPQLTKSRLTTYCFTNVQSLVRR